MGMKDMDVAARVMRVEYGLCRNGRVTLAPQIQITGNGGSPSEDQTMDGTFKNSRPNDMHS
jgi:hypothetical protein